MIASAGVDPARLAAFAFGHDHWAVPRRILRAVFEPNARVAVKSCHASSKTFTAADALLLALLLGGDVITTAPTWTQVEQVLFGRVHAAMAASCIPAVEWGSVNRTEIRLPTGEVALGLSTDQAVRFQGYHARPEAFLLVIFDEAPGVRPEIYEAVEGISAGGDVRHLLIGNPVVSAGPFFDIFEGARPGWARVTIDAFDTPNLAGLDLPGLLALDDADLDVSERPYLVTRRWVHDRYHEWGEDHPLWQSRVRGQFPLNPDDSLLSRRWIADAAARLGHAGSQATKLTAGIDVAGPGEDETVVCIVRGGHIEHLHAWTQADPRGEVVRLLRDWRAHGLARVNVDNVGIGHYFYLDLKAALEPVGIVVTGVNAGEASDEKDELGNKTFANRKAEVYWGMRERFRDGDVSGLADETTRSQLGWLRYATPRGIITIESKDDLRKRMGGDASPDRAEALALALWRGRPELSDLYGMGSLGGMSAGTPWRRAR